MPITMILITVVMSFLLSIFSTAIMGYISMAVPIGPWIAPMLVLIIALCAKLFYFSSKKNGAMVYMVSAGSIGGILATGCGFSVPTLFFLDAHLFEVWLHSPTYFIAVMAALSLCAGWFGMWVANSIEDLFIYSSAYEFPISQALHKLIVAQQQMRKAAELAIGFCGSFLFFFMQVGLHVRGYLLRVPRLFCIVPHMQLKWLCVQEIFIDFSLFPMLVSIGFIAGISIAIPLLVGAIAKVLLTAPINIFLFSHIPTTDFLLALCSGMVVVGTLDEFMRVPKKWSGHLTAFFGTVGRKNVREFIGVVCACMLFFTYFQFSLVLQWYTLLFTCICTYQIVIIAAKIGLAQLGRFATFVMVPALFLFKLNAIQIVFISTFVQIAGGVACDLLFSRKLGVLMHIDVKSIRKYQYLGLIVSSLCVGIVFLFLINRFGLGSSELFAQKAYARKLLLEVKNFNIYILFIGAAFGLLLKYVRINPMLVLGGILMPSSISLGLITGGLLSYMVTNRQEYVPFWSGVFAGNSVWMLLRSLY
jgi:hypothetical protein